MAANLDSFDTGTWSRRQYLEKLLPGGENPIVERFRRLNLLDFDGNEWGVNNNGKHYPYLHQWQLVQLLGQYEEKIRALHDPVVIIVPDLELFSIDDINKLDSQTQLKKYNFDDQLSVFFPSLEMVSERWRDDKNRSFQETFRSKHRDNKRNLLNGHYYETPFPGWSVFVCEKDLHDFPQNAPHEHDSLESLASASEFLQLTAKEAFVLRSMDLCDGEMEEAEVLLGQYNPEEDKFPVLVQRPLSSSLKYEYEIDGVISQKLLGSQIAGPGKTRKILKVRKGFRLQNLTKVADHIVSGQLIKTQNIIGNWTRDRLGQPIDVTLTPEMRRFNGTLEKPKDNLSVVMIAIDNVQQQCRMAIEKLIEFGQQKTSLAEEKRKEAEKLRQDLDNALTRIGQLYSETRELQEENDRLKGGSGTRRAPPPIPGQNTFSIQPETLRHLSPEQLKKLQRDLAKYFHPDRTATTASTAEKTKANRQFQVINDMIAAEIKRR